MEIFLWTLVLVPLFGIYTARIAVVYVRRRGYFDEEPAWRKYLPIIAAQVVMITGLLFTGLIIRDENSNKGWIIIYGVLTSALTSLIAFYRTRSLVRRHQSVH